jgi:hypothetical protein
MKEKRDEIRPLELREEARAAVTRKKGHTLFEAFPDGAVTKLYLNYDEELAQKPSDADLREKEKDVRSRVESIIYMLTTPDVTLTYKLVSRHGYVPAKNKWKVSFRPYVSGMKTRYTDIPKVIRYWVADGHGKDAKFWDTNPFSKNQLIGAINGHKGDGNPALPVVCVLGPEESDEGLGECGVSRRRLRV